MDSTAVIERDAAAVRAPDGARAELPPVPVEARVNTITGYLNAQHAELVDVVAELLAAPAEWQGEGVWTMPQWLAWRCGMSPATARQITDIARRAADLPVSIGAFRAGELSLDQMAAIARRAPWWTDEQIYTLGRMMTVTQLQRTLRTYPFPNLDADGREIRDEPAATSDDDVATRVDGRGSDTDTDTDRARTSNASDDATERPHDSNSANAGDNAAERPAGSGSADGATGTPAGAAAGSSAGTADPVDEACWFTFGDDGVFRLQLTADFDTGHVVQAALTEARDRLFQGGEHDVDWVDAIREVCDRSLDGVSDGARRSRFRVNVHLDTDATAADAAGWTLPDAIRRHLTCDGLLSPVFVEAGVPVGVGRTQRIVPDRTRTVVERRDGHRCRVPGCTASVWLEVHHIIHWEQHGETETWNLLLICPRHHRDHHRGLLGISGNADLPEGVAGAVEFVDRNGRRIQPSGASPTPPSGPPPDPAGVYEHPLGERLQADCLYFRPPPAHQAELNERIAADRAIFSSHPDLGP